MNDDPMVFLPYVENVFLTDEENLITNCKKNLSTKFWDERPNALFPRSRSLTEPKEDIP
jgi:hypothetical protein